MSDHVSKGFSYRDLTHSPAVQLAVYLVGVGALLVLLALAFPAVRQLYIPNSGSIPDFAGFEEIAASPGELQSLYQSSTEVAILGVLSLLGALLFAIPLVRIYAVTMRQDGYDKAFVRLLVALPVVVAAVVRIVQNDLALAFALAGIVAAVRFRTTVKDLQDAFYAFSAIAIGLAAGTGNFVMAGAATTVITALAYAMWRLNVGDVGPSLELPYGGVSLSSALVPGEAQRAVVLGAEDKLMKVGPADLDELQNAIGELASYVQADSLRKKKKYKTLIIGHVSPVDLEKTQKDFESILSKHASRFVFIGAISLEKTPVVSLQYIARLKNSVDIGKMVRSLGCDDDGPLYAVELKPIDGLRKRLT